ncbi:MAG: DUF3800 domain-containing protein [bacterium]
MAYIFIDESGNFNKGTDGKYFVVGSFTIGDQRRTNKAFRSWTHSRFPKKMRKQSEVKWSATGISDNLRIRTLKYIAKLDVRVKYGFLLRKNIPSSFRRKGKIESGALYTSIISDILEMYLPIDDKEIYIFCDSRSLKGMAKKEFESSIVARLLPLCPPNTLLRVEMIDSATNANIQIADWISGALVRYLENAPLGGEYYKILKNNFLGEGKEFFSE